VRGVDLLRKSAAFPPPSRAHQEGRFAIVTNVERGMRWTQWLQPTTVAAADGEVVWS